MMVAELNAGHLGKRLIVDGRCILLVGLRAWLPPRGEMQVTLTEGSEYLYEGAERTYPGTTVCTVVEVGEGT